MKVVFVSNYFNHHQKPFSDKIYSIIGNDYCFIETEELPEERKKLGYEMSKIPSYVVNIHNSGMNRMTAMNCLSDADIVITGSVKESDIRKRINDQAILIRYSERPLKNGFEPLKYLGRLYKWRKNNHCSKAIYLFAASAYASVDYAKFGLFRNKAFKWGYFPPTKYYEDIEWMITNKEKNNILWVGRMLDWKHPDDLIKLAMKLQEDDLRFQINYIGTGEMLPKLQAMVKEYNLEEYVRFLEPMKPEQVREHMEKAGIYLFTSDKREGWGAVLNESMNSGCAVVASHEIGAVPYLIEDGKNGLIYESGNVDMLYEKVKYLLNHPEKQKRIGKEAYRTINDEWNAEIAAERFLIIAEKLLNNEPVNELYKSGPCSPAEIISDKWNKR